MRIQNNFNLNHKFVSTSFGNMNQVTQSFQPLISANNGCLDKKSLMLVNELLGEDMAIVINRMLKSNMNPQDLQLVVTRVARVVQNPEILEKILGHIG